MSLVKVETNSLSRPAELGSEQVELIKRTIAKGCTDDELKLFIATAERLGLDPFGRQIFAVKRWDSQLGREVMQHQVSIDGFRVVAQRSGEYAGQVGPHWCGEDGKWVDVWLSPKPPIAARVGVVRRGFNEPLFAVARFAAYAQTKRDGGLNIMWSKMGDLMIAKCAEALALRRAFPNELGDVYTPEEMGQADNEDRIVPGFTPEQETRAAAQSDARAKDDAFASDMTAMLADVTTKDGLLTWIHHHGWEVYHLHATPKQRVWRAMQKRMEEVPEMKMPALEVKAAFAGAPAPDDQLSDEEQLARDAAAVDRGER